MSSQLQTACGRSWQFTRVRSHALLLRLGQRPSALCRTLQWHGMQG